MHLTQLRGNRLAGAIALEARALVVLKLVELQEPRTLAGGHRQPQLALTVSEQKAGRVHPQQADAALHEQVEQVERVEVVDKAVCEVYERLR